MENKKIVVKKKKFTLKKVKRFFINLFKLIGEFFKNLYNKFMSLKKHVRYIVYVWAGVFLLIIILIIISVSNNRFKADYVQIENKINDAALRYVKDNNLYPLRANKLEVSLDMLKDFGYIRESEIEDSSCCGYAKVYYDTDTDSYTSTPYINCKKYTSEGYKENK